MLLNCSKCQSLTVDYVNKASGLELHRFHWLDGDHEIGSINGDWNYLVNVQDNLQGVDSPLIHWTLGGPWFKDQRIQGGVLDAKWFAARDESMKLFD